MKNPLLDRNFLKELDQYHHKDIYAKIVSLNFEEQPIDEITGRISQGSISIDGTSAIRRSCSLTLITEHLEGEQLQSYYWGLKTKFKLFIGLNNVINDEYPDIIWFPQGIYLITSFNTSLTNNSFQVSLQGKDKMSLLNGDIGGSITAKTVDFAHINTINSDGSISKDAILLKDIILEAVHEYAQEPYHNIIIDDLDDLGLEYMKYNGSVPMYILIETDSNEARQFSLNGKQKYYLDRELTQAVELGDSSKISYDSRVSLDVNGALNPTFIYADNGKGGSTKYTVLKCEAGEIVGYRVTDLTYAGELIGNVGSSITSACLDKIVTMLGAFEYFYDLDGRFHFQRKNTYVDVSWNNMVESEYDYIIVNLTEETFEPNKYYVRETAMKYTLAEEYSERRTYYKQIYNDSYIDSSARVPYSYSFLDNNLISSFQNNPNIANIKNDFSIWGERTSINGGKYPVHLRYAIDKKPKYYKSYDGVIYCVEEDIKDGSCVDWREIIYQMAVDYYRHSHESDFNARLAINNRDFYPFGYTGYEQYYTDIYSFWRQLYDLNKPDSYDVAYVNYTRYSANPNNYYWFKKCSYGDIFDKEKQYYVPSLTEALYQKATVTKTAFDSNPTNYFELMNGGDFNSKNVYYTKSESKYDSTGWSYEVLQSPERINFWFDFLDSDGELSKYSVKAIGDRPKAENANDVKSIYFREIPTIIFVSGDDAEIENYRRMKPGYTLLQLDNILYSLFSNESRGLSAMDKLDNMLYTNISCEEQITINSIPIYYLEPNTQIFVRDDKTGINGEYIVTKISLPLSHNGTMNITASKVIKRLY